MSFWIFQIGPLLREIRPKNWIKVLFRIASQCTIWKEKFQKPSGGEPPDPPFGDIYYFVPPSGTLSLDPTGGRLSSPDPRPPMCRTSRLTICAVKKDSLKLILTTWHVCAWESWSWGPVEVLPSSHGPDLEPLKSEFRSIWSEFRPKMTCCYCFPFDLKCLTNLLQGHTIKNCPSSI